MKTTEKSRARYIAINGETFMFYGTADRCFQYALNKADPTTGRW